MFNPAVNKSISPVSLNIDLTFYMTSSIYSLFSGEEYIIDSSSGKYFNFPFYYRIPFFLIKNV